MKATARKVNRNKFTNKLFEVQDMWIQLTAVSPELTKLALWTSSTPG